MNSILRNFSPEISFWEANPVVNTIPEFRELKEEEGEERSSTIMWAIAFLLDKSEDNPWRNTSQNEAKALISSDYLDNEEFNFNKYEKQFNAFKRHLMTHAQRSLLNWQNKLEERDMFLRDTEYSLETAKLLDDIQKNTISIFKAKEQIEEMIAKEGEKSTIVGKKQESLLEKGQI